MNRSAAAERRELTCRDFLVGNKYLNLGPGVGLTCVPVIFSLVMTRADVLRYKIAFALRRAAKVLRGLKQALTEDERFAVADNVVAQLQEHGDPWQLSEEARPKVGPTTS